MFRAGIIAALVVIGAAPAEACFSPAFETGVVYETMPNVEFLPEGALVLDVAFDRRTRILPQDYDVQIANARVRSVLHGAYQHDTIEVVVGLTNCSDPFMFGHEGIIAVVEEPIDGNGGFRYIALEHPRAPD